MYYIDKIKQHFINWFEYLKEHLVGTTFLVFIIIFITLSLTHLEIQNHIEDNVITDQNILIGGITIDNWLTWFTITGLAITAIWALYQFNKNKKIQQQEKAAEIAREFATNIIEKLSIISEVLMNDDRMANMIEKIDQFKIVRFDRYEILDIFNDESIFNTYREIVLSDNSQNKFEETLERFYGSTEKDRFHSKFWLFLETTLNELEYLCMSISSNAAGSQYIYPSLHQTFLDAIHILSVHISRNNTNNVDKYFINVIAVYNMWNNQRKDDVKKMEQCNYAIKKLNNRRDLKIKKLLNKKPKTI